MHPFERDSRPWVRWWWLKGPFCQADIEGQLSWLKEKGFGGVEVAWLAPLWLVSDVSSLELPEWLGDEFSELLQITKRSCDGLGLGCDFTFGSCWPFGGKCVTAADASQTFDGLSTKRLGGSWEAPIKGYVLNHLSEKALRNYAKTLGPAFSDALSGSTSALFCDSWEIRKDDLWDDRLWDVFRERFGYDLRLQIERGIRNPHVRYDHRKLLSEVVIKEFYAAFTEICHEMGARSRVQCHGSPTELLSAYAAVDIPETEAILFNPHFSRIPASAAALAQKPVVSSETFTCIYGFPTPGNIVPTILWRREQVGDLKLLADGLFAQGVNQIIWHGMPYCPPSRPDAAEFYASAHVGPGCAFDAELEAFNGYLRRVSDLLKRGQTYGRLAVYLPHEDEVIRGALPPALLVPGSQDHAEMRYVRVPPETEGYAPLWISGAFLANSEVRDGRLICGRQEFDALYVDVQWMDYDAVVEVKRLAEEGLSVVLKGDPDEPGNDRHVDYANLKDALRSLACSELSEASTRPLVRGHTLPWYWVRDDGRTRRIFFAPLKARELKFPMTYGQSQATNDETIRLEVDVGGEYRPVTLDFTPYQSLMLRIEDGEMTLDDIQYTPPDVVAS